jgi:hypothetical protein
MTFSVDRRSRVVPRKRPKHHSYDESVDEPAKLLKQEAVEIEQEIPVEDTESIERTEQEENTAAFEE